MVKLYVIYDHPRDFPLWFVCRIFHGELAEPHAWAFTRTLEEMRARLPAGLYNLGRQPEDDPAIAEVWI
jgi:hypothetical protein